MTRTGGVRRLVPALLAVALLLRSAWPLADPPERLSWSNGVYTDPAAITHAARNAVLFGDWVRDSSRDLIFYPLLNGLAWAAYSLFGVSRLTLQGVTVVLGLVTVGLIAATVSRCRGGRSGALAAAVLGTSFWIVMFSRVPLAENLVAPLLAGACLAALTPGARGALAAGLLVGVATFLGKLHAVAFLPALLSFVALRERRANAIVLPLLGFAVPGAAWLLVVFAPHRADILDQVSRADEMYGALPVLRAPGAALAEIVVTLRAPWIFHRMPLTAALGGFFVLGTLFSGKLRRRRLENGTALFALWFVFEWLMLTALPYRAPRYFVPAVIPLAAAAVCLIVEMARGEPGPQGGGGAAVRAAWLLVSGLAAVDAAIHALAWVEHESLLSLSAPAGSLRATARAALEILKPIRAHVFAGAALAAAAAMALHFAGAWRGRPGRRPRFLVGVLVAASLGWQAVQLAGWALGRTYVIEETKASADSLIARDAVVLGAFAPTLVQDSRRVAVPVFGGPTDEVVHRRGVTHVVTLRPSSDPPPVPRSELVVVQRWPFRTRRLRAVELHRLARAAYEPTPFERGAEDLDAGRWDRALREFARHREPGWDRVPDVPAAEANCLFLLGDAAAARDRLEEALRRRPSDSRAWYDLGTLQRYAGDLPAARDAWKRARKLDPWDSAASESLQDTGS